jgi:hypothetical protein
MILANVPIGTRFVSSAESDKVNKQLVFRVGLIYAEVISDGTQREMKVRIAELLTR